MYKLHQFDKRLHSFKTVIRALQLSVDVERGMCHTICNNSGITEHNLHCGHHMDTTWARSAYDFNFASIHIIIVTSKLVKRTNKYYCDQLCNSTCDTYKT